MSEQPNDAPEGDEDWQFTDCVSSPIPSPPIGIQRTSSDDSAVIRTISNTSVVWQNDNDVSACPLCRTTFSRTFRKHHCRMCGRVVCDECSKNCLQLQAKPTQGKVRVCDDCVASQREQQATGYEEDTEARAEIVELLKKELNKRYKESEILKLVLLELDADASRDSTLLKEYYSDRETHAASFPSLQERIEKRWDELQKSQTTESDSQQVLRRNFQEAQLRLTDSREQLDTLKLKKALMMEDFKEYDKMQKEKNDLMLTESRLRDELKKTRKHVQDLEHQRQSNTTQQNSRWGIGRFSRPEPNRSSPNGSLGSGGSSGENEAFTITHGQEDTYTAPDGGGSNHRRCLIM